ncbi:MAG: SPOR domain-containing protein [Thermodesulfobacteriaceae bacterium]|nr:SPOR domain-containing protein [Thermodesulfobacteriaceae bacterium]MDW8136293.1 SPOR domain-containing protein [Thermodesulfobacterium sp.]
MEEKGKKVKIELSKLTLVFLILFGLCLLIWTFIFGAWIGSKIGGKRERIEIATEKQAQLLSNVTPSNFTPSNVTQANVTTPSSNVSSHNVTTLSNVSSNVTTNAVAIHKPDKVVAKKEAVTSKEATSQKEPTKYQKKEVAQIASVIKKEEESPKVSNKTSYYTLQVGAFSSLNSVEAFKDTLTKKGYHPLIEKTTVEGKTWYRVYVGRYSSKEEAQKYASEVKSKLGLEKVLVVELK